MCLCWHLRLWLRLAVLVGGTQCCAAPPRHTGGCACQSHTERARRPTLLHRIPTCEGGQDSVARLGKQWPLQQRAHGHHARRRVAEAGPAAPSALPRASPSTPASAACLRVRMHSYNLTTGVVIVNVVVLYCTQERTSWTSASHTPPSTLLLITRSRRLPRPAASPAAQTPSQPQPSRCSPWDRAAVTAARRRTSFAADCRHQKVVAALHPPTLPRFSGAVPPQISTLIYTTFWGAPPRSVVAKSPVVHHRYRPIRPPTDRTGGPRCGS